MLDRREAGEPGLDPRWLQAIDMALDPALVAAPSGAGSSADAHLEREALEIARMFQSFRTLRAPEPASEAGMARSDLLRAELRVAVERRLALTERQRSWPYRARSVVALLASAPEMLVAAALLLVFALGLRVFLDSTGGDHLRALQAPSGSNPVSSSLPSGWSEWRVGSDGERAADQDPESLRWFRSTTEQGNLVRVVRESFRLRYQDDLRQAALSLGGGDARSEAKARWASDRVAAMLLEHLERPPAAGSLGMAQQREGAGPGGIESLADWQAIGMGLRALLATGSSTRFGPHAEVTLRTLDWIEQRLPELDGPRLASALAAYFEGAMVTGGLRLDRAVDHAARMVDEMLLLPGNEVTADRLCSWTTPSSVLADAAVVLGHAGGLGLPAARLASAMTLLRTTLEERIERGGDRAISARVAMLHAFHRNAGAARDQLLLDLTYQRANPQWLAGDLPALQQLTWSLYRTGSDWGRFNRRMRSFALALRPRGLRDHAALALMLAVYYAAPGTVAVGAEA